MLSEDILQAAEEEWTLSGRTYTDETADSIKGQKLEFDSIHFVRCRFTDCDFTGASFCNVVFDKCDFSNSSFEDSYWKNTRAEGCKGDGSRFSNASFKWVKLGQPVPVRQFFHGFLGILRDKGMQLKGGIPVRGQVQENHMLQDRLYRRGFFQDPAERNGLVRLHH